MFGWAVIILVVSALIMMAPSKASGKPKSPATADEALSRNTRQAAVVLFLSGCVLLAMAVLPGFKPESGYRHIGILKTLPLFAAAYGFWKMRRWGVYVVCLTFIHTATMLSIWYRTGGPNPPSVPGGVMEFCIELVVVGYGIWNLKRMR